MLRIVCIIKVQHSGAACVRILRSSCAIWFYWSTNVARARIGTLLKCYAQSQNARNSDSGELRNACPSSKNFSIPANMVEAIEMQWRNGSLPPSPPSFSPSPSLSLSLSLFLVKSDRFNRFTIRHLLVILMSDNVPIIQRILSLIYPHLTTFVALSRYYRCYDKRTINIEATVAKGTQTTVLVSAFISRDLLNNLP